MFLVCLHLLVCVLGGVQVKGVKEDKSEALSNLQLRIVVHENSHYHSSNHFISLYLLCFLSTSTQIRPHLMSADPYRTPLCLNSHLGNFSRSASGFSTTHQRVCRTASQKIKLTLNNSAIFSLLMHINAPLLLCYPHYNNLKSFCTT